MSPTHHAHDERVALCDALVSAGPHAPTLCEGWAARDLAAHVVLRESRPDLAIGILLPPLAARLDRAQRALASSGWDELVERIRNGPPFWHPARLSLVDELTNLVEFAVHTEDVRRGDGSIGPSRELSPALQSALWAAVKRMAPVMFRSSPLPVSLVAPGHGEALARRGEGGVRITGDPMELLLVAYGRGAVAKVAMDGSEADVATLRATRLGLA